MSAIAGIVHLDGRPVEAGLIERMTACMAYRGIDGISHWQQGCIALGHGLLRTTVASAHEAQPLLDARSQLAIVMDGRIDNRASLRKELAQLGREPLNSSDSALALCAFEAWGSASVGRFDGDFALAIWDARTRELFCARDRIGTRSFHYALLGNTLLFASDVRAIWYSPLFTPVFNDGLAVEHLAGEWLHHDETFWQGLLRLMPAHWMRVSQAGITKACYWRPDPFAPLPCKPGKDLEAYHRWLLTDIVQTMSASDRPLAVEVSGGLDSSALFALACGLEDEGRLGAPGLKAYTFDFAGVEAADEMSYVKAMEGHCRRSIQPVPPTLPGMQWYVRFAQDFKTFPGYPNTLMSLGHYRQAAADGCRVVISGCGGDEWLGGWDMGYAEALLNADWPGLAACWREDVQTLGVRAAAQRLLRKGILSQLPETIKRPLRHLLGGRHYVGFAKDGWMSAEAKALFAQRRQQFALQHLPRYARLTQRYQYSTLHEPWTQIIQEMEDINCGLMGLEWRRPLAHPRLIQFAFSLPDHLRSSAQFDRVLHRKALKGLLPELVLQRRIKADFGSAYDAQTMDQIVNAAQTGGAPWLRDDGLIWMRQLATEDENSGGNAYNGWPQMQMWDFLGVSALGHASKLQ
jgi:asparagine synthase (glutamine-hydrolysing)